MTQRGGPGTAPKVSVLIPCFNAGKVVGETLESVFNQTWPNVEVVVVNDGSGDDSGAVIRSFARPNLTLLDQPNRGQTAALNAALSAATGDFIQYLDADDLIDPDKIALQVGRLVESPSCVASSEWGRFYRAAMETRFAPEVVWRDMDPLDWIASSRSDGLGMLFPALWLIPSGIARGVGPWMEDLTLNNDAEYFTRVLLASRRVLFCEGARCRYRSGDPSSLSGRRSHAALVSQFKVLDLCTGYVLARENSERMRQGFALSWQHFAHTAYPYDAGLAERAIRRAGDLHAVTIRPDGGRAFKAAMRLLGWRAARRLQVASGRP